MMSITSVVAVVVGCLILGIDLWAMHRPEHSLEAAKITEFHTVKDGKWNDPSVWKEGKAPPYPAFDCKVEINHEVEVTGLFEAFEAAQRKHRI